MKKCVVCKKEILPKAKVCPYCSAKQEENGKEQCKKDVTNSEEKKSKVIQERDEEFSNIPKEAKVEKISFIPEEVKEEKISAMPKQVKEEKVSAIPKQVKEEKVSAIPKQVKEEKISAIPKQVKAEKISNTSKEAMTEKEVDRIPKEIEGEEGVKETYKKENKILGRENKQFPKRCSVCGEILNDDDKYCAGCGTEVREKINTKIENTTEIKTEKAKGILKYYSIICGVFFGFFAFTYFSWLSYDIGSAKVCGFLMVVACLWSAFISFVIAFACQKRYGKHLLYAVAGGAILKIILHFVGISLYSVAITISSESIMNALLTAVVVVLYYYIMKSEEMISLQDQENVQEIVKEIPEVLRYIFTNTTRDYASPTNKKPPVNQTQTPLHGIISGRIFLALCITYTINLLYEVFADFSFLQLLLHTLSILVCVSIWLIYYYSQQGQLYTTAVSILLVTTYIRLGIRVAGGIVVLALTLFGTDIASSITDSDDSIGVALIVFIFIVLWILYWYSLSNIISDGKRFFTGKKSYIKVGRYPMVILGFVVATKSILFIVTAYIQHLANQTVNTINQFGEGTSSTVGDIFQSFGLGEYAYNQSSSIIHSITDPITGWIQNTFGFNKSPIIMIIAIAIPVLEIIILSKTRTFMQENPNYSSK